MGEFVITNVLFEDTADKAETGVGAFEEEGVTEGGADGTYGGLELLLEGPPKRECEMEEGVEG